MSNEKKGKLSCLVSKEKNKSLIFDSTLASLISNAPFPSRPRCYTASPPEVLTIRRKEN